MHRTLSSLLLLIALLLAGTSCARKAESPGAKATAPAPVSPSAFKAVADDATEIDDATETEEEVDDATETEDDTEVEEEEDGDGAASTGTTTKKKLKEPDIFYVPTPQPVVDKMLEMAGVKEGDVVYDLGCGDGRIVVTAAKKFGVKAIGFDVDPERIKDSLENVEKNDVGDLVTIKQEDIFEQDLSGASVVTLYLLPSLNVKLIPQLEKLKDGSRIVSHDFDMRGVTPDEMVKLRIGGRDHKVYLWTTPLKKEAESAEDEDVF